MQRKEKSSWRVKKLHTIRTLWLWPRQRHGTSPDFKCDQCDRNFKTDQGLKIHVGKAHKSEDEPEHIRDNVKYKSLELSLPADNWQTEKTNNLANSTFDSNEEKPVIVRMWNILTLRNAAMSNVILSLKTKLNF